MSGLLNRKALEDIYYDLEIGFIDQIDKADRIYEKIAMIDRTDMPLKRYKWLRSNPRMVPWIGERRIEKLSADSHIIENEDWAIGIEVDRDDLRNDKDVVGVMRQIRGLADSGMDTLEEEVVSRYVNGFTADGGLAYDGQFLIDPNHTINGDSSGLVQSNMITDALSQASFDSAYDVMIGFKDDKGKGLKIKPRYLLHGPSTRTAARDILEKEHLSGGETNVNQGLVQRVMSHYITDGKWFLIGEAGGMAPVILQLRQDPEFRAPVKSLEVFEAYRNKRFHFGVDATFGVAPAAWPLVVGSDATT